MIALATRAWTMLLVAAHVALLAPAAHQVFNLAIVFTRRIGYPMDVEWMEGGSLVHAHRLLHGLPLYAPPGDGFLAFPYPPGHYVALAAVGGVVGLDYWSGRLLSIAFFVLAAGLLAAEVRAAARSRREGALFATCAVGMCAASFPAVGGWYDVVRNDSLAIALVVWPAWLLRPRWRVGLHGRTRVAPGVGRSIAASLLFTAAVFTKQTAVFFIAWAWLFTLLRQPRAALVVAMATGLSSSVILFVVMLATRGWFWKYVFSNLAQHPVTMAQAEIGLGLLFDFAPFMAALPVAALVLLFARRLSARTGFWLGMLALAFPAALLPFAKAGGFLNNLIPVALLAGPVALLPALDVLRALEKQRGIRQAVRLVVLGCAAAFLLLRRYDPRPHVPSAELTRRAQAVNAFIASLQGGVVIPNHPWLAVRNGHATAQLHEMGYQDAMGAMTTGLDMPRFLARSGARWALLSGLESPPTRGWVHQVFKPTGRRTPYHVPTITGYRTGPRELLERRAPVRRLRAKRLFDFEIGHLVGWTVDGDAFAKGVWGERGWRHVNTWHPRRYDAATGTATSPGFALDRTHVGFLIAGGQRRSTRVDLVVEGRVVLSASGVESDIRIEVLWDVRPWTGMEARLVIADEESGAWGHVIVDDVELFDAVSP